MHSQKQVWLCSHAFSGCRDPGRVWCAARERVQALAADNAKFKAVDRAIGRNSLKVHLLLLSQLMRSPIAHHTLISQRMPSKCTACKNLGPFDRGTAWSACIEHVH